jgi:uncharacterized protein YaeQ
MALTATIYNFDIELADTDRRVYETLALRLARHPSESEEYLVARLLAYLLEFAEGIEFSRGVSDPEEPTIAVRDLTGAIKTWIDIGTPDASRLHKASKVAGRVAVYTHKDPTQFLKSPARRSTAPRRWSCTQLILLWLAGSPLASSVGSRSACP